jgi:predicted AlkP superfamily pyrophosphatase or phosphodiesterase
MKVVLILLDAFRQDYISKENSPFLYDKSKKGMHIERIIPSAGFCERTEIFFGLKPNESGYFTAIGFDSDNGIYKNDKGLQYLGRLESFCSRVFRKYFKSNKNQLDSLLHKITDRVYFKFFGVKKKLKTYKIPHLFLKYFDLTEDKFEFESLDSIKGRKSILKIIQESGGKSYLGAFTSLGDVSNGDDVNRIKLALEASKSYDFIPIYINCIDSFGHKFGPNSLELKSKVKELDQMLENAVNEILAHSPDTVFYFLGDHGMSEVKKHVDIKKELYEISKKNNFKEGKDFIYFLDSTLMRIWFFNENTKNIFEQELKTSLFLLNHGTFLDKSLSNKYCMPQDDRRYGDLTWWANEGVLIFPDFFHNEKIVKGMHGYVPITQSTYGTCIVWSEEGDPKNIKELELIEVYNLLKNHFYNKN